jgi:hypothetical protein
MTDGAEDQLAPREKARADLLKEMQFYDGGENALVFNAAWDAAVEAIESSALEHARQALAKASVGTYRTQSGVVCWLVPDSAMKDPK